MLFAVNVLLVLLLSLVPGRIHPPADPHGFRSLATDNEIRHMLIEGRLGEFDAAVEGFVMTRLMIDVKARAQPRQLAAMPEAAALLNLIKVAAKAAVFAVELKTLGPRLGMRAAVGWVESGLVRKTGLRQPDLPSLFAILRDPGLSEIPAPGMVALEADITRSHGLLDSSYERLFGLLKETL